VAVYDGFCYISVGLIQQTKLVELDSYMTDKERLKFYLS